MQCSVGNQATAPTTEPTRRFRSPGGTPSKMDPATELPLAALLIAPTTTFMPNGRLRQQRPHLQQRPLPLPQQQPHLQQRPLSLLKRPQQHCRPAVTTLQAPPPQL